MVFPREIFFPDFFALLVQFNQMEIVTVVLLRGGRRQTGGCRRAAACDLLAVTPNAASGN